MWAASAAGLSNKAWRGVAQTLHRVALWSPPAIDVTHRAVAGKKLDNAEGQ